MHLPNLMRVCHTKKINKTQNVLANQNSFNGFLLSHFFPPVLSYFSCLSAAPLFTRSYDLFSLDLVLFNSVSFTDSPCMSLLFSSVLQHPFILRQSVSFVSFIHFSSFLPFCATCPLSLSIPTPTPNIFIFLCFKGALTVPH